MFEVGFSEILLVMIVALLVLGPQRLPKLAADVGRWMGRARAMARQLRHQLDQEVNVEDLLRDPPRNPTPRPAPPVTPASTPDPGAPVASGAASPPPPGAVPMAAAAPAAAWQPPPNPPAAGADAPAVGAPTDDLHSHAHAAGELPPLDDAEPAPEIDTPRAGAGPASRHDGRP